MANRELSLLVNLKDKASAKLNELNGNVQKMQPTFKNMATVGTLSFAAISGGVLKSVQTFAKFEQAEVAFESMLGSADEAVKMMEELQKFSAGTPFQFQDIANATRTLVAFGSSGEEARNQLKFLGDISAGAQVPLNDLSVIFGKVQTKGKAMTEEIMQMAERGIPIIDSLATQFGVGKAEIFAMAEQGKLTSDVVVKALQSMTEAGGIFEGQMEKQSETLIGRWSTLNDNFQITMNEIGDLFDEKSSLIIQNLTGIVAGIGNWIKENPTLSRTVITASIAIAGLVAVVGGMGLLLPKLYSGLIAAKVGIVAMTKASYAFITTPMGAILAAIAIAVVLVGRQFMKLADEVGGVGNAIKAVMLTVKGYILDAAQFMLEQLNKISDFIPFLGDKVAGALDSVNDAIERNDDAFIELMNNQRETGEETESLEETVEEAFASMESGAKDFGLEIENVTKKMEDAQKSYRDNIKREDENFHDSLASKVAEYELSIKEMREKALAEERAGNDESAYSLFMSINEKQRELNKFYSWEMGLEEEVAWEKEKLQMGELERMRTEYIERKIEITELHLEELRLLDEKQKAIEAQQAAEQQLITDTVDVHGTGEQTKVTQVKNAVTDKIKQLHRYVREAQRAASSVGISKIRSTTQDLISALPIPGLATGGIVTKPTLAMVGEAGPEAVIPLSQLGRSGGTTVNITVNGDVSGSELVEKVKRQIFKEVNRQIKL